MTTIATEAIAKQCCKTPAVQVVDNRGLAVRGLQYNRSVAGEAATQLMIRQRYTPTGPLLSSLDPRLGEAQQLDPTLPPNFRYMTSLSGRQLHSQSQDAGSGVRLYDIEGGPLWQRASRGQCTRWTYDALHRPALLCEQASGAEPERISERYTYADGSAVAAAANGRGRLLTHYDTAGLNETPCYSLGGQVQLSVRRLLRAELPSDWQGDEAAWEAALEQQAYTSHQGFDALGRVAWSLDAKGNRQQLKFNVAGQLLSSQLTLAGQSTAQTLLRSVRYSAAGQVQQEEAGNGVVSDYRYEAQTQRLNRLTVSRPAQNGRRTLLQDLEYDYDPVGNILAIGDAAQPVRYYQNQRIAPSNTYTYDALYQLLSATGRENADAGQQGPGLPLPEVPISSDPNRYSNYTRRYSYDRGGNLTQIRHQGSKNYTQDLVVARTSNRALAQSGFLTPADVDGHFDAAGNLKQLALGQPLTWDGRNQLQEVLQVQRDSSADDREWYRYDGGGQRVQKTSVSQTSATQRQAEVLYLPGLELRRTLSVQGDTRTVVEDLQVIRGQGAGRAPVRILHWDAGQPAEIPNDQLRFSLDNQIGSSLLELDQAADILTLEEYFPFGGTAVWAGRSASETEYKFVRYSGKERDATGLYYYGFRYYAPWLGRWLNPDPAGTVDGLNLYRMVGNNPVTYKDVDGRWEELPGTVKEITAKKGIVLKRTVTYQGEEVGVYGSTLGNYYTLTQASINNVYNGGPDATYIGVVSLTDLQVHLLPIAFKAGGQYAGAAYPNVTFEVSDPEENIMTYKTADRAVSSANGKTSHEAAISLMAGGRDLSKAQLKSFKKYYLGFTFAPELSADQQGGRYNLAHFHGRSRTLNISHSPGSTSDLYAADYYMKSDGKVLYQAVEEDFYSAGNAANGRPLYGDPVPAAKGTLSDSIQYSIQETLIASLTFDPKYNERSYSERADAIYSLAQKWGFTHTRAPRSLPSGASASQFQAATPRPRR